MGARPIVNITTPTAAWPLNGTGTDVIGDVDLAWTGTPAFAKFSNGQWGAQFNGSSYLTKTIDDAFITSTTGAIEFKVRCSITGSIYYLMGSSEVGSLNYYWYLRVTSTGVIGLVMRNTAGDTLTNYLSSMVIADGKDKHIIIGSNGTSLFLYVDGLPQTFTGSGAIRWLSAITNRDNFILGGQFRTAADYAPNGTMLGAVNLHNGVVSDAMAAELYTRSKAPVQNSAMIQLPIAARTPIGSPTNAWAFYGGDGFGDVVGANDAMPVGASLSSLGGFRFNGTGYATTAKSIVHTSALSICAWVKSTWSGTQTIFGGSAINCIQVRNSGLNLQIIDGGSGSGGLASTTSPLVANKWQLITMVWDAPNNMAYLYVDKTLVASGNPNVSTFATTNLWFGKSYNGQNMVGEERGIELFASAISTIVIDSIYNAGVPENRENELFFSHNMSQDLSVGNTPITRIGGAKITRDGLLCDGASGGAYIADKIGVGDVTIYTTIYPTTLGEGSSGIILNNGKFHARLLTNNVLSISSDDSTFAESANNAISLLVPIRLCITRTSAGVVNAWKNATEQIITDGASGAPAAATTDLYFGNRAADDRTFAGLKSDTRINSGIDTLAQILADNARYGFK